MALRSFIRRAVSRAPERRSTLARSSTLLPLAPVLCMQRLTAMQTSAATRWTTPTRRLMPGECDVKCGGARLRGTDDQEVRQSHGSLLRARFSCGGIVTYYLDLFNRLSRCCHITPPVFPCPAPLTPGRCRSGRRPAPGGRPEGN